MKYEGKDIVPAAGYVIVRKGDPGKTKGGIVVPGSARSGDVLYVVESSPSMLFGEKVIPCELRPGDQVWFRPEAKYTQALGWPPDHMVVNLDYLVVFARETPS